MARDQAVRLGRRRLLQGGVSVAGLRLAGCGGAGRSAPDVVEAPPETTTLKLDQRASICRAPQYLAKELLRHEGFTDIQYIRVQSASEGEVALAAGDVNINLNFAAPNILRLHA